MTPPQSSDSHLPPGSPDRRVVRPTHLVRFWNLIYAGLRKIGVHVSSFYVSVGVFLIAGALIAIIATMGFAELAEHVLAGGTQAFDVAVLQWIHVHQTPLLTQLMVEMTYLGTGTVVMTVVGVAALFLWHTEHKHSARLLLAATAGSIILNNALKLVYHRARPSVFEWQTQAMSSSFPSGHAMSATVVYGTVAYLLVRLQKHTWAKALTLSAAIILILLICLTRLYLGVHYPSDVLGGIVVGLAWAAFCMATLEASLALGRRRAPREVEEVPAPKEAAAV
jgi:undecaprenyl-diphosphatase